MIHVTVTLAHDYSLFLKLFSHHNLSINQFQSIMNNTLIKIIFFFFTHSNYFKRKKKIELENWSIESNLKKIENEHFVRTLLYLKLIRSDSVYSMLGEWKRKEIGCIDLGG